MITLTPPAAGQIKISAKQGRMEGLPLRIAVSTQEDGSFHYAMGFDDSQRDDDVKIESEGISLLVSPSSMALLTGTTIDYVELEQEGFHFIFMNPNDPSYEPPDASGD